MADPQFSKVERAFQAALAAREAGGPADVTALCEGDAAVAAEVRSLLRHLQQAGGDSTVAFNRDRQAEPDPVTRPLFLDPAELHAGRLSTDPPDRAAMMDEWGASAVGQRVGEFTLVEPIGAGGMGVVFLARQERPDRTVAIKLVRRTAATPELIRRFEREAQVLARLNHPGIAQVYAAGVADVRADAGATVRTPYIAMELVNGSDILQYLRGRSAEYVLVLRLIAQVCDAVQHAHHRGVIHRDLKPANVLVTAGPDGQPQVKVLDFGVARESNHDRAADDAQTRLTFHGHLVGTLAYMSPEQIRGGDAVDARTDVYALGVMLYQLLAGRLPIEVAGCPLPEVARRIVSDAPPPLGSIDRTLRGDVETIVARALDKDPARRYESPAALARDLRHHLVGELIEARRDSVIYLLSKRVKRYRSVALLAVLMLGSATSFALYATRQEQLQAWEKNAAVIARSDAEAARRRADDAAADLSAELSAVRVEQGRLLGQSDLVAAERLLWDEMLERPNSLHTQWALRELYWRTGCVATIAAHAGTCRTVSVAPAEDRFATAGEDGFVRIWSLPGGDKLAEFAAGAPTTHAVRFSPDGKSLAVAGAAGTHVYDLASGARRALGPPGVAAFAAQYAAGRPLVAVGSEDGVIRLFDTTTLAEILTLPPPSAGNASAPDPPRAVDFDPATSNIAVVYLSGRVKIWRLTFEQGRVAVRPGPEIAGHTGANGAALRFSPDGRTFATGGTDRSVKLWRVDNGSLVNRFITYNGTARSIEFTPDGNRLVVPGYWRTQLFDVATGKMSVMGDGGGFAGQFAAGGHRLIVGGTDGTCRVWDFAASPTTVFSSTAWLVRDLAVARLGEACLLASIQADGELRVRERRPAGSDGTWIERLAVNVGARARTLAMSSDGSSISVGRDDGRVITLDTLDGHVLGELRAHAGVINAVRLSPDGRTLVTGGVDKTVRLWNRRAIEAGGEWEPGPSLPCDGEVIGAAFRPDGAVVATTNRTNSLRFWSATDGKPLHRVVTDKLSWKPTFSPDGRWLAAGSWDLAVRFWNAAALPAPASLAGSALVRHEYSLRGHAQLITAQAFDEGGTLLASVSNDGALRIWDVAELPPNLADEPISDRRRCLATFDAGVGDAYAVTFLPATAGGRRAVAVGYIDGTVRVWNLDAFDAYLRGHADYQAKLRNRSPSPATTYPAP